ncbi:unnamed protein product [Peniophora sp. CBMAI 1063]|nr:unnamed protein product [Peniophora sp. CBMAI 1063]
MTYTVKEDIVPDMSVTIELVLLSEFGVTRACHHLRQKPMRPKTRAQDTADGNSDYDRVLTGEGRPCFLYIDGPRLQ